METINLGIENIPDKGYSLYLLERHNKAVSFVHTNYPNLYNIDFKSFQDKLNEFYNNYPKYK